MNARLWCQYVAAFMVWHSISLRETHAIGLPSLSLNEAPSMITTIFDRNTKPVFDSNAIPVFDKSVFNVCDWTLLHPHVAEDTNSENVSARDAWEWNCWNNSVPSYKARWMQGTETVSFSQVGLSSQE